MNRLPADVAHEVAAYIASNDIHNPHPLTVEYAVNIVRMYLLKDTFAWMKFITEGVA